MMKKMFKICCTVVIALVITACENDLELFNDPTCRLNFYYANAVAVKDFKDEFAKTNYSFVYSGMGLEKDTIWLEVESMGFVSDHDRPITLEQVDTAGVTQAVPGKHYVAFNDPAIASYYVMPAGKARTKLPVVLLRDKSLSEESVVLKIQIKSNEYFQAGYDVFQSRSITFTDRLSMPNNWEKGYPIPGLESYFPAYANYLYYFIGRWGQVKHQFLIEQTGQKWDDDYIESLMTGDDSYLSYLAQKMAQVLAQVNAERQAQGLGVLCEADGTPVSMDPSY